MDKTDRPTTIKRSILIVDDSRTIIGYLQKVLHNCGYETLSALSAAEAQQILADDKNDISLVFLDVAMPEVSGIELLKIWHSERVTPTLPVIMLSTTNDTATINHCHGFGIRGWAVKPISMKSLENITQRYCN